MRNPLLAVLLASAHITGHHGFNKPVPTSKRRPVTCCNIHCDTVTDHKGGFCSSDCCDQYRAEQQLKITDLS